MGIDVARRSAATHGLLERLRRGVVFALLEEHPALQEGRDGGAAILMQELVEAAPRAFDVPGLEVRLDLVGESSRVLCPRRERGDEGKGRENESRPHLTSSS